MPTSDRSRRASALSWLIAVFVALQVCSPAEAQSSKSRADEEWHGWQNLTIDGAAIAMFSTALALEGSDVGDFDNWLAVSAVCVFALGSPIIDAWHGNGGLALGSFGLRVVSGVLLLFGVVAHAIGCQHAYEEEEECNESGSAGWYVGGALVGLVAIALDAGLDREPRSTSNASLPIGLALRRDGALVSWRGVL
jgi:hypothetical protein